MLPALRPCRRLPVWSRRRLLSSAIGEGGPPVDAEAAAAAAAKARAEAAARARMEAYKQVQNFDWSSGADWKTAANILFTVPPKRKEFGTTRPIEIAWTAGLVDDIKSQIQAVYLVAQYAQREIKRMETDAEEKRKKDEEVEKQKQLEESAKEDADSKLSKVLDWLDTLEVVIKEIVDDKRKVPSDLTIKEEVAKKDEASPTKAPDLKRRANDTQPVTVKSKDTNSVANADLKRRANDTQPVTVKSKDTNSVANAPANTTQPNSKRNGDQSSPAESKRR